MTRVGKFKRESKSIYVPGRNQDSLLPMLSDLCALHWHALEVMYSALLLHIPSYLGVISACNAAAMAGQIISGRGCGHDSG